MSDQQPTPADALAHRYGRSGPTGKTSVRRRWSLIAFAAVAIAAAVAFAAWVGFQDKPVSSQVFGYDVVSDTQVTVSLDVVTPDPIRVKCTVFAQAEDQAIVGEKTVTLEPSETPERRVTIDVATQRRAVTGTLRSCDAA